MRALGLNSKGGGETMCEECKELSRRNFLKGALIGGTALGMGFFDGKLLHAQTANIKFSTWHPPVSKGGQDSLDPHA